MINAEYIQMNILRYVPKFQLIIISLWTPMNNQEAIILLLPLHESWVRNEPCHEIEEPDGDFKQVLI